MALIRFPRFFRFSLRTLFVAVTVLCLYFGWQWRIVHERKVARTLLESPEHDAFYVDYLPDKPHIPWIRRLLGDSPIISIGVRNERDKDIAQTLFPEAEVHFAKRYRGISCGLNPSKEAMQRILDAYDAQVSAKQQQVKTEPDTE